MDIPTHSLMRSPDFGDAPEITRGLYQTAIDSLILQARMAMSQSGDVPPAVFLFSFKDAQVARLGIMDATPFMTSDQGKEMLGEIIGKLIEHPDHDLAILVHEAWMVSESIPTDLTPEQQQERMRQIAVQGLRDNPEREEILVFVARSKQDEAFATLPIEREQGGSFEDFGHLNLHYEDQSGKLDGTFSLSGASNQAIPPNRTLH